MIDFAKYHRSLEQINPIRVHGKVSEIIGLVVEGHGPAASIGEVCMIAVIGHAIMPPSGQRKMTPSRRKGDKG